MQKLTLDVFPRHSESVERHFTKAAASLIKEMRRDRYVRAKLLSSIFRILPQYDSSIYIMVHFG